MNRSRRHHYIPQFLTRHFANEDGQLHVYDKINDKFYRSSAINLFVEADRNTFTDVNGGQNDVIERIYSSLDAEFSVALNRITATGQLSSPDFKLILFFAYISKWRVRVYDESFKIAKEAYSVDDLGLGLKDEANEKLDFLLENIFLSDMQQELKRFLLAAQPFRFKEDYQKLTANSFIVPTHIPAFIGDCPFNEATLESDELFEDFIFPLTRDLTLVYSPRVPLVTIKNFLLCGPDDKVMAFKKDFSCARDVSTLDLAERIIACSDEEYLRHTVSVYKEFKRRNTGTAYHLTVFNVLYNFKEYTIDI